MPKSVLESIVTHLQLEQQIGGYEAADRSQQAIEHFYEAAANLIGCSPYEIAFTENASRAWDMAFYSIPFNAGDRILVSTSEYASNYISLLQIAKKKELSIEVIPNDAFGQVSIEAFCESFDERVKLVTLPHIPHNSGLINPVVEVGRLIRATDAFYILDACQSAGQLPIDVDHIGCDMLITAGRKYLRGPRGTGFLYVRQNVITQLEPPFLDIHAAQWVTKETYKIRSDARRFETWEVNYAAKIGLGVAIDYALQWGIDAIWAYISLLAYQLRTRLSEIPEITLLDLGENHCGIVTFNIHGRDPESIRLSLTTYNINVSVSTKSLVLLDMENRGIPSLIRASLHYYNTTEEVDYFCEVLLSLIKKG